MNDRLQLLIDKGYSKEDILRLSSFTEEELNNAANAAFKHISRNITSVSNPEALFVGGQPGCGKSSVSLKFRNKLKNTICINIDNYRMYHPKYQEIEAYIREKNLDSMESDIAEITNSFAGAMSDILTELAANNKYNLILDWGMREPIKPLETMQILKNNGYKITIIFVVTNKDKSYSSCNLRSEILNSSNHILRKVTKDFHDECVTSIPISANKIFEEGCYDNYYLINRNGYLINYDKDNKIVEEIYNYYLNNEEEVKIYELSVYDLVN